MHSFGLQSNYNPFILHFIENKDTFYVDSFFKKKSNNKKRVTDTIAPSGVLFLILKTVWSRDLYFYNFNT